MAFEGPILDVVEAVPAYLPTGLPSVPFNLRLMAGECALVLSRDRWHAQGFSHLCSGMIPLERGNVRMMGLEWDKLKAPEKAALRGRIGRIVSTGAWVDIAGVHINIIMQQMHHTRRTEEDIVAEVLELGEKFGLPGLPTVFPKDLSPEDQMRAAYVRAFLGSPPLLLLEYPVHNVPSYLVNIFFEVLSAAQNRGAAVLCFAYEGRSWRRYQNAITYYYRLQDNGLLPLRV